jgi:hypothetical protein
VHIELCEEGVEEAERYLESLADLHTEEELGIDVKRNGRGGVVHRSWQNRIQDWFLQLHSESSLTRIRTSRRVTCRRSRLVDTLFRQSTEERLPYCGNFLPRCFHIQLSPRE